MAATLTASVTIKIDLYDDRYVVIDDDPTTAMDVTTPDGWRRQTHDIGSHAMYVLGLKHPTELPRGSRLDPRPQRPC